MKKLYVLALNLMKKSHSNAPFIAAFLPLIGKNVSPQIAERNFSRLQRSCCSGVFLLLLLLSASSSWGQVAQTETLNPGITSWQSPVGVTEITVKCWGGGGGGGRSTTSGQGGSGGGSGGYTTRTISLTAQTTFVVVVGNGGTRQANNSNTAATVGGNTSFQNTGLSVNLIANGGGFGAQNSGAAGAGGSATGGSTNTSGGAGAVGGNSGGAGGNAPNGGSGGAARLNGDGNAGTAPGGGGGGGEDDGNDRRGGNGGAGRIVITFTIPESSFSYFRSTGDGDWSELDTWEMSTSATGNFIAATFLPTASTNVLIQDGDDITLDVDAYCNTLILEGGGSTTRIIDFSTRTLTVTGNVLIEGDDGDDRIEVLAGNLICGSITMENTGGDDEDHEIQISTGSLTVSGNIVMNGTATRNAIRFSGTGTLNVGGNFNTLGSLVTFLGNTVNYNGAAQTARVDTYLGNVTLSGSGVKTFATTPTVNGVLSMEGTASAQVTTGVITYGSSATLQYNKSGAYTATSEEWITPFAATGGINIINTGAITNANTVTVSSVITGAGSLINTGTLNTSGNISVTSLSNSGTIAHSGSGNISTALANFTNTGTLNISGSGAITGITNNAAGIVNLASSGTITNFNNATATSTLNISASSVPTITTLTTSAAGNTVNYNRDGNQAVRIGTYSNLVLSGSGAKTFASAITGVSNFSISGTATATFNATGNTATTLTLRGFGQNSGTWGGTGTGATNISTTFFNAPSTPSNKFITISTVSCTTGTWLGTISNNWATATNWCGGVVPTASTDVVIPSGTVNQPTIATGTTAVCRNLTINASATLTTANNATSLLNISGDFTNNGTLTAGAASTVSFVGTVNQLLDGSSSTSFSNLIINTGTASIKVTNSNKVFAVTGNLTVTRGNLNIKARDLDYIVTGNLSVATNGTLTHEVNWDETPNRLVNVGGNIAIDGVYTKGTVARSHIQMTGSSKTVRSGTSSFNIFTINTSGAISANGALTVDNNFWAPLLGGGSFSTNNQTVIANGSLLISAGGTLNVNGGSLTVIGGMVLGQAGANAGTVNLSSGTLITDGITIGQPTSTGTSTACTFNQSGGTLQVNGNVTINQPIANSITNSWNIDDQVATVTGLITFEGLNTEASRIGRIRIKAGTLNADGGITFVVSSAATKVIDMSGGAGKLNLKGALTIPNASSTLNPGTSGSTFSYVDAAPQTINKFSAGNYYNLAISGAGLKTFAASNAITNNLSIANLASSNLGSDLIHTAATLTLGGSAQSTGSSYGGTGSAAATINSTYFANNTGIVNVGSCTTYSLTSTTASSSQCINAAASVTLSHTTASNLPIGTYTVYYTLSGANTGSFNSTMTVTTAGSGSFSTGTLSNNGSTTITINYIRIASAGCVSKISSANTATFTVNPAVTITLGTNPTITQTTTTANLPYTANNGAQAYITFNAAAVAAGFTESQSVGPLGASGNIVLDVPYCPIGGAGTFSGTLYIRNFTTGCNSTTYPFSVTIASSPAPTGAASQSFCPGATVANLAATGSGIKWYAASSGGIALASSTALVNGNHYYASQNPAGCESTARLDVTVTITPAAPATPSAITGTATHCPGLTGQVYSIAAVTNASTYNWTVPTGWSITAGAGTTSITVTTGSASQNGNVSVTAQNSCGTSTARTMAVTVSANNTVGAASSTPTVCINTALTSFTHTTTGATGIANAGTAGANGLPAGVAASWNSNTITIYGTPSVSGTFGYSIPLTGGCGSVNATGTITVSAAPNAGTLSGTQNICAAGTTTFTTSGNAGGAWTSNATGIATVNISSGVVTGIASGTATITYTVTGTGGCANATATRTVTVAPNNTAGTASSTPTVVINTALTNITHTTTGATGILNAGTIGANGLPPGVAASLNNNTITIYGTPSALGTYNYSIPLVGGCGSVNATGTITVIPANVNSDYFRSRESGTWAAPGSWEYSSDNATWYGPATLVPASNANMITIRNGHDIEVSNNLNVNHIIVENGAVLTHNDGNFVTVNGADTALFVNGTFIRNGGMLNNNKPISFRAGATYIQNIDGGNIPLAATFNTTSNLKVKKSTVLSETNTELGHLDLESGTLDLSGNKLIIRGNMTRVNGTINAQHANSTIEMAGTTAQTISGTMFNNKVLANLVNNNAAGIRLSNTTPNDTLKITKSVGFGDVDNSTITTNGNLTLVSTATATAAVDDVTNNGSNSGNQILGNVTVERSLYRGRKWRLLSAPTHGQSIRDSWQERGTNVSGDVLGYGLKAYDTRPDWEARGFDGLGGGTSIKKYSPTTNTWDAISSTHSSINAERGYLVFVSGDFTANYPNYNDTRLRTSGKLFTGDSTIKIPRDTFALIGNPYASRIDLRKLNFTGFDPLLVAQAVYVWDPAATRSYGFGAWRTLLFDGTNYESAEEGIINNFIESGQAFFVKGGVGTNYITFQENDKTDEVGNTISSFTAGASQSIRAVLNLVPATGSPIVLDGVKADFGENYSNSINAYDIKKMGTINESVSWKTNESLLVVDRRAMIVNNDTLHLNNSNYKLQNYQWQITSNNLDFPGRTGFLVDRYTGTVTPLDMAGTTTINFSVQNIAGSYAADRFKIVFNQVAAGPLPVTITTLAATRNTSVNNEVTVSWKVESETNMNNYEVEYSADGSNFTSIATVAPNSNNGSGIYNFLNKKATAAEHFYRIKANSIGGLVQYSAIVKVAGIKASANSSISVYPNPVVNKKMNVQFVNQAEGNYQVSLYSNNGALVYKNNITVNSSNLVKVLPLHDNVAAGNYQMIVTDAAGNTKTQSVIVL